MKKLLGIVVLGLLWCGNVYADAKLFTECKYFVDKLLEGENGKFKERKPNIDEKELNVKIYVVKKINDSNYEGYINGAGHKDKKVTLIQRPEMIEIIQRDAANESFTAIYTIFYKSASNKSGVLSSMNETYVSNFIGPDVVNYYQGYCKLNNKKLNE